MEKVREVWYDAYMGFPIGGSCPQSGLMRAAFRRSLFMGCPRRPAPHPAFGHLPPRGKASL